MAETGERRTPRFYWAVVLACALATIAAFRVQPPIIVQLRNLAFDAYQHMAPAPTSADLPVRVVEIDESSLARIGQWPWPRSTMAALTQKLSDAGAAAIVFDVLFAEPDRTSPEQIVASVPESRRPALLRALGDTQSHDALFAAALQNAPTVLAASLHDQVTRATFPMRAGLATAGDDPRQFLPDSKGVAANLAPLTDAAHGVGFMNWIPDGDQVIRRVPLLLRQGDQIAPSLSLEALRVAAGASTYVVRASNANGAQSFGAHTGISDIKVGPFVIPTDAHGGMWLRFHAYDPNADIPAWRVLAGQVSPDTLRGTIVLIGASAPGLMDLRATPLDTGVPGVEIHRQVLEQILSKHFLTRPDFAPGVELILALIIIAALAFAAPRTGAFINAAIGLVLVLSLWLAGALLYARAGYLFDPTFPTFAALAFGAGATIYFYQHSERQRAGVRRAFSQYVAPSVVNQLAAHPERLKLGGEVRELTILMCDIRNFSAIAEKLNAQELTAFINSFLTPLTDIILERGGTIDKYMGDAIMAFWNAPLDQADHAKRACEAAALMLERMRTLNQVWREEANIAGRAFEDVRIGIGVNSGECCVGNLGSERRFDYSAIGDAVNIASRLESLTKTYGLPLLVAETTVNQVDASSFVDVDLVRLKGRAGATRVFTSAPHSASEHDLFLSAYRAGRFDDANARLATLREDAADPLPELYRVYAARLATLRDAPPPEWDGVFEAAQK